MHDERRKLMFLFSDASHCVCCGGTRPWSTLRAISRIRVKYCCFVWGRREEVYVCSKYCRRGASVVIKPRLLRVNESTQNVSMKSRIFGTVGKAHSVSSSLMPCGRIAIMYRISRAPGPRLVNVGDDNESSIVADNPGVWWVCSKETRRFSHSRNSRE